MEANDLSGLEFLQDLETKHDQLLDDLDALDERITSVLRDYSNRRHDPAETQADPDA